MVSPWGRGISTRGMGGKSSRGGAHRRTALNDSWGRHGGGGGRSWRCGCGDRAWIGAAGRGRGGAAHLRPEGVPSAGLHHGWAREGEEVERGSSNLKWRFEIKRITGYRRKMKSRTTREMNSAGYRRKL